ncbi:MAG: hypothetical protein ACM3SW_05265 [Actinomycetota bacterium]
MGFLFSRGEIRKRFLDHWHAEAPKLLNVISGVPCPVVSRKAHIVMTTATGLDNRFLLPPFMPSGKGEDVAYGLVMGKSSRDSHIGIVPVAVLHARQTSSIREKVGAYLPVYDFLSTMIEACTDHEYRERQGSMEKLGTYLVECGELAIADFKEYLKRIAVMKIKRLMGECDRLLNEFHYEPEHWAREMRAVMKRFEQQLLRPELGLLLDLPGAEPHSRCMALRQFVREFGELLRTWPDIVTASLSLQRSGYRIGRQL